VRVLDRERQRPKYHLVYVTTHPLGVIEFMTISENVDLVQKQVRAELRASTRGASPTSWKTRTGSPAICKHRWGA
jgi:hypothetical protein